MKQITSFLSCTILMITVIATSNAIANTDQASINSHMEAASTLLEAMQFEKTMNDAVNQMVDMQTQANPEMHQCEDAFRKFFSKYMSGESLKKDMVELYVDTFTEKELKQLTAFYKTDLGQLTINKIPQLMQKGAEISQAHIMEHIDELQALFENIQQKSDVAAK